MVCCHKSINNEHILSLMLKIPLAIFCQCHDFQLAFLAHLAHSAKVSFWDRALSVVRRRASSCVVRQQFT